MKKVSDHTKNLVALEALRKKSSIYLQECIDNDYNAELAQEVLDERRMVVLNDKND